MVLTISKNMKVNGWWIIPIYIMENDPNVPNHFKPPTRKFMLLKTWFGWLKTNDWEIFGILNFDESFPKHLAKTWVKQSAAKNPKIRIRMGHFSSDVFEKLLTRLSNQGETQSFTRPETAETSGGYIQCSSQRNQPNQLREWGNSRRKKRLTHGLSTKNWWEG